MHLSLSRFNFRTANGRDRLPLIATVCVILFGLSACYRNSSAPVSDLVTKGKSVYQTQCIACHNSNPKLDGALGPAVYGAGLELLERRVVHGDYPENYKPKRKTKVMQPLPHLKPDLEALHAYLNQ